jgi:MGT family glycosyltransferase
VTAHRFLFVVPPLAGHVNPTVAVGGELLRRGHDVAWTGYREVLTDLLPPDRTWIPVADRLPGDLVRAIEERAAGLRGAAALKFLWEDFLHPMADDMVAGVERAVAIHRPDVVVVDQQTVAGAVVAERSGLTWATSATTSAELVDPFASVPKIRAWADRLLVDFQVAHGIPARGATAERVRCSRHLVLAFTTAALTGPELRTDAPVAFVGPAVTERPDATPFPWDRLEGDRPTVLVSLGTVNAEAGGRFFGAAVEALAERGLRAVVVAPPELVGPVPDHIVVRARVPQLALLPHVDAVVCHAGHNTVCEALQHAIPLVVAPIRDDQPVIAEQVVAAGAGVRVRFARPTAATLGAAIDAALHDPARRAGAAAVAASFVAAGGAPAAADHLEQLARDRTPAPI